MSYATTIKPGYENTDAVDDNDKENEYLIIKTSICDRVHPIKKESKGSMDE